MTEAEWEAASNPVPMLAFLKSRYRMSFDYDTFHRRCRAFVAATRCDACQVSTLLDDDAAMHVATRCRSTKHYVQAAILRDVFSPFRSIPLLTRTVQCDRCNGTRFRVPGIVCGTCNGEGIIAGNADWLTLDVRSVAQAAYDSVRENGTLDPVRLAVLADALEEAGCTEKAILEHLRRSCYKCKGEGMILAPRGEPSQGTELYPCPYCFDVDHVPGCWVLDLILGEE